MSSFFVFCDWIRDSVDHFGQLFTTDFMSVLLCNSVGNMVRLLILSVICLTRCVFNILCFCWVDMDAVWMLCRKAEPTVCNPSLKWQRIWGPVCHWVREHFSSSVRCPPSAWILATELAWCQTVKKSTLPAASSGSAATEHLPVLCGFFP